MLWRVHTARAVLDAVLSSFFWPWAHPFAGGIVVAIAAIGFVRLAWWTPRTLGLLAGGVRAVRDLPSVVPGDGDRAVRVAARDSGGLSRRERAGVAGQRSPSRRRRRARGLVSDRHPARDGDLRTQRSPAFRALAEAAGAGAAADGAVDPALPERVIGIHAGARRAVEWLGAALPARVLTGPHGREWLTLVEHWKTSPRSAVVVRGRSAADGSRALRSGGQVGAAAVPVGVRRAALRRRRASGQFRRLRHASARLDAGPRMGADGRSRRRHRTRRPRTPPEAERRVDPEPQRRSAADDRRPPPWSGHGSRRPHRPDA